MNKIYNLGEGGADLFRFRSVFDMLNENDTTMFSGHKARSTA